MTKKELIDEIISGIHNFKIIPFIGAGLSKGLGFKVWGEIIEELKVELTDYDSDDYLEIAQEYENRYSRATLIEKLKQSYSTPINPNGLDLAYLILSMQPPIVYTTNYDEALETAARELNRQYYKVASLKDIVEAPHNAKVIVKFHGDFSAPENIVFTRRDYDSRLQIEHELDILFRAHLLGKGLLFLGYSFRDENIDFIFTKHAGRYDTKYLPKSYLVTLDRDAEKERKLLAKNIITVHIDSYEELPLLAKAINQEIFFKDTDRQFESLFQSTPLQVFLKHDLENIKKYLADPNHTSEQKGEKLREAIELRLIPQSLTSDFRQFCEEIIFGTDLLLKEAIVHAYSHIHFRTGSDLFSFSFSFLHLTQEERFLRSLENAMEFLDILSLIEARLKPDQTVLIVLFYVENAEKYGITIQEKQALRFIEMLLACNYKDVKFNKDKYSPEQREKIVGSLIQKYPTLKKEMERIPFIPRRTISQIEDTMLSGFSKKFLDKL